MQCGSRHLFLSQLDLELFATAAILPVVLPTLGDTYNNITLWLYCTSKYDEVSVIGYFVKFWKILLIMASFFPTEICSKCLKEEKTNDTVTAVEMNFPILFTVNRAG